MAHNVITKKNNKTSGEHTTLHVYNMCVCVRAHACVRACVRVRACVCVCVHTYPCMCGRDTGCLVWRVGVLHMQFEIDCSNVTRTRYDNL